MKVAEFNAVKNMTYLEYCDYLQKKYGIGRDDYMSKSFRKKPKVSRTSEGLFAHHKFENKAALLSNIRFAKDHPYEWQKKENIVYCDYLEHLFLHVLICKYPDPQTLEDVGIGGIIDFLVPELNDIYSGWIPKLPWQDNCRKRIIEDMNVYLAIIKMFITYLQENRGLTFDNRTVLHSSANERYGCWSKMQNEKIYTEIDSLWEKK